MNKTEIFKKPFTAPSGRTLYTYWMRLTRKNKKTIDIEVGLSAFYELKCFNTKEIPYENKN